MGWIKKEARAFGREFFRQGSILIFGKVPKRRKQKPVRKPSGAEEQYRFAQRWAKKNGFK